MSRVPHTEQGRTRGQSDSGAGKSQRTRQPGEPDPHAGARRARSRAAAARCCGVCLPSPTGWRWSARLFVVTAASGTTEVGTLFWAMLFSPIWVLVLKLHGLYDNDHRRIRHSTLDELPSLVSASVLGVLALDGLLALSPVGPLSPTSAIAVGVGTLGGSFVAAGVAALPLAPADPGRQGDRDRASPPRSTWSPVASRPIRRHGWPWSATSTPQLEPAARELPRLGSIADISEAARDARDREGGGDRRRDERAGGRAADRGVQGGGPGADLPAPALRPARAGHRAEPACRAARARLPLQRPAALDDRDEAGHGRRSSPPSCCCCCRRC